MSKLAYTIIGFFIGLPIIVFTLLIAGGGHGRVEPMIILLPFCWLSEEYIFTLALLQYPLILLWHFRFYTHHWSLCSLVLRRGLCGMRLIFALLAQKLSAFQESPFRSEGAKRPMLRIPSRVPK
jgi:hypothetical protein